MKTWIALLKGANVGGKNKLPMKLLSAELESIGLTEVQTYIQSGNVVFCSSGSQSGNLAEKIDSAVKSKFGFDPHARIISAKELSASASANPFPEVATELDGKFLHFFFLSKTPSKIDHDRIEGVRRQSERWQIKEDVFYLHTPEGFGDSKLAAQVERILGVTATARNWRTVSALIALAVHAKK